MAARPQRARVASGLRAISARRDGAGRRQGGSCGGHGRRHAGAEPPRRRRGQRRQTQVAADLCDRTGDQAGRIPLSAEPGDTSDRRLGFGRIPAVGSSPRMRGTHVIVAMFRTVQRFIPAHAGNTRRCLGTARGSRFIPAHAGNTVRSGSRQSIATGSSPRMRGTRLHQRHATSSAGSSPRMRGTRERLGHAWSTPVHPRACGEHTSRRPSLSASRSVHPRACGEHCIASHACTAQSTVHPRACGEHALSTISASHEYRFIPAHAGNTSVAYQAHDLVTGSSPRMRGTRAASAMPALAVRFIPAHAGNTESCTSGTSPRFIPAHAGNTT